MKKSLIAGNWKMNKTLPESMELIRDIKGRLGSFDSAEVMLIPPFTSLFTVSEALRGSGIQLGAQNLSHLAGGAVTGEVSGSMLVSAGCRYVLVGHSERRKLFHENGFLINQKMKTALTEGLHPLLCVGETWEEHEAGLTRTLIQGQLQTGLADVTAMEMRKVTLAYEPVWAIGTGKTAQPQDAQDIHRFIRDYVQSVYGDEIARGMRILYGGSVTPENSSGLLSQPDINGALVGGASLDADSFYAIIKAVQ